MDNWQSEWVKAVSRADSLGDLRESISKAIALMGFQYYIFHARLSETARKRDDVSLDNCGTGWGACHPERFNGNLLSLCGIRGVTPILWRHVATPVCGPHAKAQQLEGASGCIHAVHGPGGRLSVMSFIKDRAGEQVDAQIKEALPRCELVASCVHDAASRIFEREGCETSPKLEPARVPLSERERQVLTWAAAGKTASETATILSISERTVLFYLCSARQKLDASNSRHAICKALSLGLIDLNVPGAAPPRWRAQPAGPRAQ